MLMHLGCHSEVSHWQSWPNFLNFTLLGKGCTRAQLGIIHIMLCSSVAVATCFWEEPLRSWLLKPSIQVVCLQIDIWCDVCFVMSWAMLMDSISQQSTLWLIGIVSNTNYGGCVVQLISAVLECPCFRKYRILSQPQSCRCQHKILWVL